MILLLLAALPASELSSATNTTGATDELRCREPQTPESPLKPALYSILKRGDLSDVDALSRSLHIGLKLRTAPQYRSAVVTSASEYVSISGFQTEKT